MCFRRMDLEERDATRIKAEDERDRERHEAWRNTAPRDNQEPDAREVEREVERLETLVPQ